MIKKYRIAYGVFLFLALLNLFFPPRNIMVSASGSDAVKGENFGKQYFTFIFSNTVDTASVVDRFDTKRLFISTDAYELTLDFPTLIVLLLCSLCLALIIQGLYNLLTRKNE